MVLLFLLFLAVIGDIQVKHMQYCNLFIYFLFLYLTVQYFFSLSFSFAEYWKAKRSENSIDSF